MMKIEPVTVQTWKVHLPATAGNSTPSKTAPRDMETLPADKSTLDV